MSGLLAGPSPWQSVLLLDVGFRLPVAQQPPAPAGEIAATTIGGKRASDIAVAAEGETQGQAAQNVEGTNMGGRCDRGATPNTMQERMEWFQGPAACLNRSGALGIGLGVLLHGALAGNIALCCRAAMVLLRGGKREPIMLPMAGHVAKRWSLILMPCAVRPVQRK